MCACHGDKILETLSRLTRSAKGLPRTQEALADAFLMVFIAFCDDRRDNECRRDDETSPDKTP